jgi:hypothetical protein
VALRGSHACKYGKEPSCSIEVRILFEQLRYCQLL